MSVANNKSYTFTVGATKLSSTGITFYELSYTYTDCDNTDITEIIWRRYSEVRDLYKILSKRYSKLSVLPKGSYLDRFKPEVIESRKQNISNFFKDISQSEDILRSKEFSQFLIHSARRSSVPTFGIEKLGFSKHRHTTLNEACSNPLFSNDENIVSFKSSASFQECERDMSSSHEHTTEAPQTLVTTSESERNSSPTKSNTLAENTSTSPYQSLSSSHHGFETETDLCFSNESNNIESIGSGSDESYQAEVELHSINPFTLDTLIQPIRDHNNIEIISSENPDLKTLLIDDPEINSNGITSNENTPIISNEVADSVLIDTEWWDSVVDETENALKELDRQTRQHSRSKKKQQQPRSVRSVYETLPLDTCQTVDIIQDDMPCPNPVNISNSEDTAIAGFEGVTQGGELYSEGIVLCKQGKLEEGLTQLERGIEMFFEATRNQNLDANYKKKLRTSLKKYLTYAEQVKTQLNELNLQSETKNSSKFPLENNENHQTFKTPITLDELKVIRVIKNKFLLVESTKNLDSGQHPFLLKTVQKSKINYVDIRHRHIRMSRNLIHSCPHPNIVQLLGSVQSSHLVYMMLEFLPGRDLSEIAVQHFRGDFLQSRGDDFIRWTTQLISTLEELHVLGLFYLHLCPWDVIISDSDNSIKLTYPIRWEDLPDPLQDPRNIPYIAYECTHPITPVYTEAADWWSLGAICYELVTGQKLSLTHPEGFTEGKTVYFPSRCFTQSTLNRDHVCSFISQLLTLNCTERMHYVNTIKQHPIFNNVNWAKLRTARFNLQSSQERHF